MSGRERRPPPDPESSGLGENDLAVVPLRIAIHQRSKASVGRIRPWRVAVGRVSVLAVPPTRDPVFLRIGVRSIDAHPARPGRHLAHHLAEELLERLLLSVLDAPARDTAIH